MTNESQAKLEAKLLNLKGEVYDLMVEQETHNTELKRLSRILQGKVDEISRLKVELKIPNAKEV